MGVQLFPVFDQDVSGVPDLDGKILARAFPDDENGPLWPLVRFHSVSLAEVRQCIDESEEAGLDFPEIVEEWFSPAEAIEALDGILNRAASDENFLVFAPKARIRETSDVVKELRLLREQLRVADQQGARFHLFFCL